MTAGSTSATLGSFLKLGLDLEFFGDFRLLEKCRSPFSSFSLTTAMYFILEIFSISFDVLKEFLIRDSLYALSSWADYLFLVNLGYLGEMKV